MDGSIPDCIWKLNNLETLNLAGNGLKGTISKLSNNSLSSLTLSHNYLSGTIPSWLLEKNNMKILDLSHNKLTGDLDKMRNITTNNNKSNNKILKLTVNRLSGHLSSLFNQNKNIYSTLDILSGNVFGCNNIPDKDENSEYYVCGSSEYDRSMIVMGIIIGLLILLFIFYL